MTRQYVMSALAGILLPFCGQAAVAADNNATKFEVAAELSSTHWYTDFQKPYFNEILPKASDGSMTANAVPFDQLGLTGFELMRLMKKGTIDIASVTMNYVTQDSPALNGGSLGGITPNLAAFEKVYSAYRPVIERELATKYNAKPLALFAWPQNQIFCNFPGQKDVTLASLKGKKIRSFATTVSDLMEGLGAVPVTIPFGEVVTALQRGTVDCQSASLLGTYTQKIYEVLTHKIAINLGYSASFIVINLDTWNNLTPKQQEILSTSMADLEHRMQEKTAQLEADMQRCLTNGPCPDGKPAGLIEVVPTKEEAAKIKDVIENRVLKRYAERCNTQACIDDWNSTVGATLGLKAWK
ncbi:TRAP transporter substrate-binding protein [Microvirga tunisiensis]|uniref:TRAP transporter substrate-binding protein n=1 Tax=Microvirga tunisiensis TaxID=2108360 RepID=A0A5N7MAD6_9HYPH|nr:TRAP transporter substrate-binding protein [Microvirga tunisiensis]MPR05506.1 TRAP transporter substrate-binding protein [Microvirga tunisiensis]MPR23707.1 TRAP transporter substrate-binding protein [Microvirga tunisiensis]